MAIASRQLARTASLSCVAAIALMMTGCPHQIPVADSSTEAPESPPAELGDRIDAALHFTQHNRSLSLQEHAAWQILHGALAFEDEFLVEGEKGQVSAVKHLLDGGEMNGWTVELVPSADDSPGLRAILEEGSKTGQGHADQWLAVLSQCGLKADQPIRVGDATVRMSDYVKQVQADAPRNLKQEYSWTLIGLTQYLPTDASWTAVDGEQWSIERLIEIESGHDLASSACGGTHRVIGLAMTLDRRRAQNKPIDGVWADAQSVVDEAVANAKRYQNPDGSFSTSYFAGPGASPDLAQNLGATGHIVEFLAIALDDEELEEPWVRRSVAYLCEVFEKTREVPLECGALYHAAHGLVLYRKRTP